MHFEARPVAPLRGTQHRRFQRYNHIDMALLLRRSSLRLHKANGLPYQITLSQHRRRLENNGIRVSHALNRKGYLRDQPGIVQQVRKVANLYPLTGSRRRFSPPPALVGSCLQGTSHAGVHNRDATALPTRAYSTVMARRDRYTNLPAGRHSLRTRLCLQPHRRALTPVSKPLRTLTTHSAHRAAKRRGARGQRGFRA